MSKKTVDVFIHISVSGLKFRIFRETQRKGLLMFYKELDDYSNIFENLFQNLIDICYLFHSSEIIVLDKITQGTVSKFAIC